MDIAGYDELGLVYGILEFSKKFLGIEPFWFWAEGWSLAWKINLWARFRNGNRALELIRNVFHLVRNDIGGMTGGGVYPNLFGAHPPFQIDENLWIYSRYRGDASLISCRLHPLLAGLTGRMANGFRNRITGKGRV